MFLTAQLFSLLLTEKKTVNNKKGFFTGCISMTAILVLQAFLFGDCGTNRRVSYSFLDWRLAGFQFWYVDMI